MANSNRCPENDDTQSSCYRARKKHCHLSYQLNPAVCLLVATLRGLHDLRRTLRRKIEVRVAASEPLPNDSALRRGERIMGGFQIYYGFHI